MNYLSFQKLVDNAILPARATDGDAGLDLYCAEDAWINGGDRALVGTGIAVEIPYGYVGLIHPRSGLAHKHGITVLNAPGTIDAGYRGEIKVNLYNSSAELFWAETGTRIAQLVIQKVELPEPIFVSALSDSVRGAGGHGSSGLTVL